MKYLSESVISKMDIKRLRALRRSILAHINRCERDGHWCCDLKCEYVKDENHTYPDKDKDYAYRDLVNRYYDAQANSLVALINLSNEDIRQGKVWTRDQLLA